MIEYHHLDNLYYRMLSLRHLVRAQTKNRILKICSCKFSDKKVPPEEAQTASINNSEEQNNVANITEQVGSEVTEAKLDSNGEVIGSFNPRITTKYRPPTYDVAWPEVIGGEVQTRDSAPVAEVNVAKKLKGECGGVPEVTPV